MSEHKGSGVCLCGCGQEAPKWKQSYASKGVQKGDYKRFISGHQYVKKVKPSATCHPDRPAKSKGLCGSCYNKALQDRSPETREAVLERRRKLWAIRYASGNSDEHAKARKNRVLQHRYGLSLQDYEAKLAEQSNRCAICNAEGGSTRASRLYVDHNHSTGAVRDFLCPGCNKDIGVIEKGPDHLIRLVQYLQRHAEHGSTWLGVFVTHNDEVTL